MIPFDSTNIIEAITRQIPGSLITPDKLTPGKFSRFSTNGKTGDRSGYIKIYPDGEGAVFGCMRQQLKGTWQIRAARTPEEKKTSQERIRQAQEEAALILSAAQEERSRLSAELLLTLSPASPDNPYLQSKNILPHGAKQDEKGNLIVFVYGSDGKIHGHQIIKPDGSKMFAPDTAVKGHYFAIGKPNGKIFIAEGFSTGATSHEATGQAVACAFNAGNLEAVARVLRAKYPEFQIIICADDDHRTEGNPGITKATEAARAVNGLIAVPSFSGERESKDTDFNDMARLEGLEAVRKAIEAAAKPEPIKQPESLPDEVKPRFVVVSAMDLMSRDLPPRETLLHPWLPGQGLTMVYGGRGTGKTFFGIGVAYAVASSGSFLGWNADVAHGVLYLDGEMPAITMKDRLAKAIISNPKDISAPFHILTPDLQPSGMLDLGNRDDQAYLERYLDGVKLIIVDNLSTLCRQGRENEGEGWLPVQEWALRQRAAGRSVLFIHHAGKDGNQRGTSRREDVLDTVIALRRPKDYSQDKGACFELYFEKARGFFGEDARPFEARLITLPDNSQEWTIKTLEDSTEEKVANLLNDGVPQSDIPEMLGLSKGAISKARKRAIEKGLIKNPPNNNSFN